MPKSTEAKVIKEFHKLYYSKKNQTWGDTCWLGFPVLKCPLDLWMYQQILFETRPDLIIETGTWLGGSALYLASICELMDHGRVVTIDIEPNPTRPNHPRIIYLSGSSTSSELLRKIEGHLGGNDRTLVILDSDHHKDHVLTELRLYSQWVSVNSYLIVEDTNLNGHPVEPTFGPGPKEAVIQFLAENTNFEIDIRRESFLVTANAGGYLRRMY